MPRQLWIADKCREWGLDVHEEPGWQTRGSSTFTPLMLVAHHTVGRSTGDYPSLRVVRDGRSDLPGPLSQCGLGRSGTVYVIAAGRANHAGGRYAVPWKGISGNTQRMGIEAESVGTRDDWTPQQREAYPVLCAALLDGMGRSAAYLCGHRECATNKIDPAFWDMDAMRRDVAALLAAGPNGATPTPDVQEDDDMIRKGQGPSQYIRNVQFLLNRFFTDAGGGPPSAGWLVKDGVAGDQTFIAAWEAVLRLNEPGFTRTGAVEFYHNGLNSPKVLESEGIDPALVSAIAAAAVLR